jgi:hypothetical protein
MVMDVVLWDAAAAAVGVSVVLVSVFAIFVVSLSSQVHTVLSFLSTLTDVQKC